MARLSKKRRWILYKQLWVKGGPNFCFYCKDRVSRKRRSLDHLIPHSRGGGVERSNIVLCCRPCNNAKSDMTVHEFNEFVKFNGGIIAVRNKYGHGSHSRKKELLCQ